MRLLIATSNPGKLRDFAFAASAYPAVTIEPLPNLNHIAPPEETAETFEGNALLKAQAYSALAPGQIVVADDSGILLPALNGAPGVHSARYAARQCRGRYLDLGPDERNNACLLANTQHLAAGARQAVFRCVLAAVRDGESLAVASGELAGELLRRPRGEAGFGYDPLFFLPELRLSMAEIDLTTRLQLGHRGRALRALLQHLLPPDQRQSAKQ